MAGMIITGAVHAPAALAGAPGRFQLGLRDAAHMVGQMLVRRTQQGMRDGPQTGRTYPGLKRQSSAAGEYPAIQSGQLVSSLGYDVHGANRMEFGSRGAFNRGFDYAVHLHENLGPRPFLTLTVNKERSAIERTLGEVTWRKILGGA